MGVNFGGKMLKAKAKGIKHERSLHKAPGRAKWRANALSGPLWLKLDAIYEVLNALKKTWAAANIAVFPLN